MRRLYLRIWFAVVGCGLVGLLAGWWVSDRIEATHRATLAFSRTDETAVPSRPLLEDEPGPLEPTIVGRHGIATWLPIGLTILGMGVLSYPVVRRLTRRLEALQDRVTSLGEGDLEARVEVAGRDEISELARSFNRSAERISELLKANRSLLANSSHELRSPLTRMRLALELLVDNHPQVHDDRTFHEIRRSLAEMDQIIEELLTSSQLHSTSLINRSEHPVALAPIIAQEIRHLAPSLATLGVEAASDGSGAVDAGQAMAGERGDADGRVDPGEDPCDVEAFAARIDPVLFRRLARNLIENAVKYGEGRPIRVGLARQGDWIELRVTDHGPGIPEIERERIFEPFYRRKGATEAKGGVGLGLALVRQIAELHGGATWCEANLPEGSRFVCRLRDVV